MRFSQVGVIGAGIMGSGVAQNLSQTGHSVVLVDSSTNALEKAKDEIATNVRLYAMFNRTVAPADPDEVLSRIVFTSRFDEISEVDMVVENITENFEAKKAVYLEIDSICKKSTLFGVNTSAVSITRIGAVTKRASQVIGMHFMNPVPLKNFVELVRGHHTSEETVNNGVEFVAGMGKRSAVVNDFPGFVANRVSHLMMNEAAFLVQDGVASPEDIDIIFKEGYGHKMGPLETADLIGLDTVVNTLGVLYNDYQDPKFRCCPLLRKMVDGGLFGKKSGQGFFTYNTTF